MPESKQLVLKTFAAAYSPECDIVYSATATPRLPLEGFPDNLMDLGLFYEHLQFEQRLTLEGIYINIAPYHDLPKRARGWRYGYDLKTSVWYVNEEWPAHWVVFAKLIDASCLFADVSLTGCPVYCVIPGDLNPILVSDSFINFLSALTILVKIEKSMDFKIFSKSEQPSKQFIAALKNELKTIYPDNIVNGFLQGLSITD